MGFVFFFPLLFRARTSPVFRARADYELCTFSHEPGKAIFYEPIEKGSQAQFKAPPGLVVFGPCPVPGPGRAWALFT